MEDKILKMFFEPGRWEYALEKGVCKSVSKAEIYQLTKPETRALMYQAIRDGKYEIAPPHTARIPKDNPGEYRTVYVNEPVDRIFLSIANDILFELCPEMIHPNCKSYQKGIGCGRIVQAISRKICETKGEIIGWKSDFSKYFDSVPIRFIDEVFDQVEAKHGHSAIIDVLRKYYHCDFYFDKGELKSIYQSLKQGCSVASWLANVVMYSLDERLSKLDGEYVRYSDDALFVGPDYEKAMEIMEEEVALRDMRLNPKKIEYLKPTKWFKFLGFSIKGSSISLSHNRIKAFQKEIQARTIKMKGATFTKAKNAVNKYLYLGNGEFSWATQVLPIINVEADIQTLSVYVLDCLRAVITGKDIVGGLGYIDTQEDGCIRRGLGANVKANRNKTEKKFKDFLTIGCMRKALLTDKAAYDTLVASM